MFDRAERAQTHAPRSSAWRSSPPLRAGSGGAAAAPSTGSGKSGANFGVSRLGIPTVNIDRGAAAKQGSDPSPMSRGGASPAPSLGAASPGSAFDAAGSPPRPASSPNTEAAAASTPDRVRYIHIPQHAVKDFRDFARGVAAQACRDVATNNPYVQALNRHRQELESPLTAHQEEGTQLERPTLEQLLSTKREALSTISAVGAYHSENAGSNDSFFYGGCGQETRKNCGLFGTGGPISSFQCCTSRGDLDELPISDLAVPESALVRQEALVYPLSTTAAAADDFSPPTMSSPTSACDAASRHSDPKKKESALLSQPLEQQVPLQREEPQRQQQEPRQQQQLQQPQQQLQPQRQQAAGDIAAGPCL